MAQIAAVGLPVTKVADKDGHLLRDADGKERPFYLQANRSFDLASVSPVSSAKVSISTSSPLLEVRVHRRYWLNVLRCPRSAVWVGSRWAVRDASAIDQNSSGEIAWPRTSALACPRRNLPKDTVRRNTTAVSGQS
jgi:hypothetical protein